MLALDLVVVWLTDMSDVARTLDSFQRDPRNIHAALSMSSDAKLVCGALTRTHRGVASKANLDKVVYAESVEDQALDRLIEWEQWKRMCDLGL